MKSFPEIEKLREEVWFALPYIVYGGFAAIATIFYILFIEETKDKIIPDSIED